MPGNQLEWLISRYISREITPAEQEELAMLVEASDNEQLQTVIYSVWNSYEPKRDISGNKAEIILQEILEHHQLGDPGIVRRMFSWKRIAVAASILLVVGLGGYFMFFDKKDKPAEIVTTVPGDVKAPETNRAMITLADGRTVFLDTANNGTLATQNNIKVIKTADGKLVYQTDGRVQTAAVVLNTLTNPRGSKVIDMTLADGSRVWLNAGSSVTYPVAFVENERKVSISGEAYFEVAHNSAMPFKVSKGEMEITVLGTHFNVNGYDDENEIKVTLLEGSVKVLRSIQGDKPVVLKPGQQARVASSISVMDGIDTEEVMAWKNGKFQFRSIDIKTLMRQIARWYDVEVVYTEEVTKRFNGKIPMTMSAANVFKVLEETGGVHFKIEEKRVTVMR